MHWLLRGYLQHKALEKMREAAAAAAVRGQQPRPASPPAESAAEEETSADTAPARPPEPCHVAIVFALKQESGSLLDRMQGVLRIEGEQFVAHEGGLAGRRVVVVDSGPGQADAAKATDLLIDGHRPRWVISAGFAGGLADQVRRGDIVMADRVGDVAGRALSIDLSIDPAVLKSRPGLHVGRLLTVDGIVRGPDEKRALARRHQALACDMETLAVAETCRRRKVRFMAVRVISDGVDDELPPEVDHLLKQKSLAGRLGAATGALFRRPSSAKDLYKLKENALLAADKLAKFLEGVVAEIGKRGDPSSP